MARRWRNVGGRSPTGAGWRGRGGRRGDRRAMGRDGAASGGVLAPLPLGGGGGGSAPSVARPYSMILTAFALCPCRSGSPPLCGRLSLPRRSLAPSAPAMRLSSQVRPRRTSAPCRCIQHHGLPLLPRAADAAHRCPSWMLVWSGSDPVWCSQTLLPTTVEMRITATGNISKITKAMKMVAAAKLRAVQERNELARPFT